jgi:glycosyltransferase involved in cell wall biosynthesis
MNVAAVEWVIACEGFHVQGGMDRANAALALHLAERGARVHLVTHRVDGPLRGHPRVAIDLVPTYGGLHFTSDITLDRRARQVADDLRRSGSKVLVIANGGNCSTGDVNWVHSVHHAWPCRDEGAPAWFRLKNHAYKAYSRRRERESIRAARVVIANSNRTSADVVSRLGVGRHAVHTVYLGSSPAWVPPDPAARQRARRAWCRDTALPLVVFIGALGHDVNKGIDRLLPAWRRLCDAGWRGELVIAGAGSTARWQRIAAGAACPVRFAGYTSRTGELFDAADLLVSPVRYEAYGLAIHEAVCRGVPVIVSGTAGVTERLDPDLAGLFLHNPEDVEELVARMSAWAADRAGWRERTLRAGAELRSFSEEDMAAQIVSLCPAT